MNNMEPAQTELAAPIAFKRKKDKTLQCYVDYNELNAVVVLESNPYKHVQMHQLSWCGHDFLNGAQ